MLSIVCWCASLDRRVLPLDIWMSSHGSAANTKLEKTKPASINI
jgi:hypothetical protein